MSATYGPAFEEKIDGDRVRRQHEVIRDVMLGRRWATLAEIAATTGYAEASISAQLRHLRKERFGAYRVEKRRRASAGAWEYRVRKPLPPGQLRLFP